MPPYKMNRLKENWFRLKLPLIIVALGILFLFITPYLNSKNQNKVSGVTPQKSDFLNLSIEKNSYSDLEAVAANLESELRNLQRQNSNLEDEIQNNNQNIQLRISEVEEKVDKIEGVLKDFGFCLFNWDEPKIRYCAEILYNSL